MALTATEEYLRCPICHSIIGVHNTFNNSDRDLTTIEIEDLETEGIYVWSHDPLKTRRGLAGDVYKGLKDITPQHLQELQEARQQQEIDSGIEESERTSFTTIDVKDDINKQHIRELRQSTEKILESSGQTLEDYFNYDEEGTYLGTQEYGQSKADKTEWKRVDRTIVGQIDEPYLPTTLSNIYALDIEELRCPIAILLWTENFIATSAGQLWNFFGIEYHPTTQTNLLKRQGDYLGTRYSWTGAELIDFDADLTSANYPTPQGGKLAWSLYQLATPGDITTWSSDSWSNLIFTGHYSGRTNQLDCSNSYVEFIEKEDSKKDVMINTDIYVTETPTPASYSGELSQLLYYYVDETNLVKFTKATGQITFTISDYEVFEGSGLDITRFRVAVPLWDSLGASLGKTAYLTITANGDYTLTLDDVTFPDEFYIKYIQFESYVECWYMSWIGGSGHTKLKAKLVTPITIRK